jgi:nickel-type superoxide dismutase maturation protease
MASSNKQKPLNKKQESIFPFIKYRILGNSMYPTLKTGSNVLVFKYFFSKPKIGDIITARDPKDGKTIIKRIIKIENKKYFVQGDNKEASTDSRKFGLLDKNDIIGKVIFVL